MNGLLSRKFTVVDVPTVVLMLLFFSVCGSNFKVTTMLLNLACFPFCNLCVYLLLRFVFLSNHFRTVFVPFWWISWNFNTLLFIIYFIILLIIMIITVVYRRFTHKVWNIENHALKCAQSVHVPAASPVYCLFITSTPFVGIRQCQGQMKCELKLIIINNLHGWL